MFVRCFYEVNVSLDKYELFALLRVAGHYTAIGCCSGNGEKTSQFPIRQMFYGITD